MVEVPEGFFGDLPSGHSCLLVFGTARLDSLDSDELVADPFSFPTVRLILPTGQAAEDGYVDCDSASYEETTGARSTWDLELTEGASAQLAKPFVVPADEPAFSSVAVEETIYVPG